MKQDYTDINIVLDKSGSMSSIATDVIGGFNQFLQTQQAAPGDATISLIQFDDVYQTVYEAIDIKDAEPLTSKTFVPRGNTALLDAIGRTINAVGNRLSLIPEEFRPNKVVFVIITDGFENASKEFNSKQINEMIEHQKTVYSWEFVFLGANQDAIAVANNLGIQGKNAMTYAANSAGTSRAFRSVSKNLSAYRGGTQSDMSFDDSDRDAQTSAGVTN